MNTKKFKILIDQPAKQLALGYKEYAETLADIIRESHPQFAIGIFGGWGTGKTTLMQGIRSILADENNIICVDFCAWRYEKEQNLMVPLLVTIQDSIKVWRDSQTNAKVKEAAGKTLEAIALVLTSFAAGFSFKVGLPNAFEVSYDVSKAFEQVRELDKLGQDVTPNDVQSVYYSIYKALKASFESFSKAAPDHRIVVFVDDLDRCLPKNVIQILESMKLFFDLFGFIFVVGLDQTVVEWCIDINYRNVSLQDSIGSYQIRGHDYLKKIFQVPFSLFPVSINQIDDYINSIITENALPVEQEQDIRKSVTKHLRYIISESGINPREIKRFINAYTLNIKIKPDLNPDAILALKTIEFRPDWRPILQIFYAYGEAFLDALASRRNNLDALSDLLLDRRSIPESFLSYVSQSEPGHPLLTAKPLDEYIRSGIATSRSKDIELLNLIKDLGNCRRGIEQKPSGAGGDWIRVRESLNFQIDQIYKTIEAKYPDGPFCEEIKRSLNNLKLSADSLGPLQLDQNTNIPTEAWTTWSQGWESWKKEFQDLLSVSILSLVKLYEAGI